MFKKLCLLILMLFTLSGCFIEDALKNLGLIEEEKQEIVFDGVVYDDLQIHFLELGNEYTGDSVYIKANDLDILIDAGSRKSSSQTIKEYVNQYCKDKKLEYVISTHAHQDHIAGFIGNKENGERNGIMYSYEIDTLIDFSLTNSTSNLYQEYLEAVDYLEAKGTKHYTAGDCFDEINGAKRVYDLGNNITLEILYNFYYYHESNDENNYSVCAMLKYKNENEVKKFIFTGDLEKDGEEMMAEYYSTKDDIKNVSLYKGGHHGSKTSSNECLLDILKPEICCVCCCAGSMEYSKYRESTFPTQEFINRIAKHTDKVYVTSLFNYETNKFESLNGNIIISSGMYDEVLEDGTTTKKLAIGVAASNNVTKLKDSNWFNKEVYVINKDELTTNKENASKVKNRTLPKEWQ